MKKLLISTAIVGAVAFAPASQAADLQVNVGGFLDFQAAYTNDDYIHEKGAGAKNNANSINSGTESEINFSVNGKADNGLEYGAVIELEADVGQADARDGGTQADKAYLFAQGGWGRVEAGNNTDASEALSVNTGTFASATGGIDGDFYRYTVRPTATAFGFITRPDLPIAISDTITISTNTNNQDSTKVTYYSPRFAGFQAGVSYIPNSGDVGTVPALAEVGYKNVLTGGVNYAGEYAGVGVKAAVTAQHGAAKAIGNGEPLNAYDAGVNLSYAGFTLGGSYGDYSDTFGANTDADYYDLGLGYATGPYSASVTYLRSKTETAAGVEDKFRNLSVGADYKAAPGLVPYVEANFFEFDGNGAAQANNNSGTVVIAGSKLTF